MPGARRPCLRAYSQSAGHKEAEASAQSVDDFRNVKDGRSQRWLQRTSIADRSYEAYVHVATSTLHRSIDKGNPGRRCD
jgi:hypothetical protein